MPLGAVAAWGARACRRRSAVKNVGQLFGHAVGGHSQVGPAGRISASTSGRMRPSGTGGATVTKTSGASNTFGPVDRLPISGA